MTTPSPTPRTPPPPVSLAVRLMYVIAALGLVGILLTVTDTAALRAQAHRTSPALGAGGLDTAVAVAVASSIIGGLIGAAVWILFAVFTRRGRNWARIVAFVLSGLIILAVPIALANGFQLPDVVTVLEALCGIGVIVLLARGASSRYFAETKAARQQLSDPGYPAYPPVH